MPRVRRYILCILDGDALDLITKRVALNGECYWFTATCHTARSSARRVAATLDIGHLPCTNVASVFTSIARVTHALTIDHVYKLVHADMRARHAEARPQSRNGLLTWSPTGEIAMARTAPVAVLSQLWKNWTTSCSSMGCFAQRAAQCGRVDLLDHMLAHDDANFASTMRYHFSYEWTSTYATHSWVETCILRPALLHAQTSVLDWYVRTRRSEFADDPYHRCFKHLLVSGEGHAPGRKALVRLCTWASQGSDPYIALDAVTKRLWPTFGQPCRLVTGGGKYYLVLLLAMSAVMNVAVDSTSGAVTDALDWVVDQNVAGEARAVLLSIAEQTMHNINGVWRLLLVPTSVPMYNWIIRRLGSTTQQGWLTSLCTVGISGGTPACASLHLADSSISLKFSWALHVASEHMEDDELRAEAVASALYIYVEEDASSSMSEEDLLKTVFNTRHAVQCRCDADDNGIEAFLQRVRRTMFAWHATRRQCADSVVRQIVSRLSR